MRRLTTTLICLLTAGCGTPIMVRNLSSEQLKAQLGFRDSLRSYFGVVDLFAQAQLRMANAMIDEAAGQIERDFAIRVNRRLDGVTDAVARQQILNELVREVRSSVAMGQANKLSIEAGIQTLKAKHEALRQSYDSLLEAQQKLDEYVQLRKTDEVVAAQLVRTLGISQETFQMAVTEVGRIADEVLTTLPQIRELRDLTKQ